MKDEICLVLHRKSANELPVKAAVKAVRSEGIDLRVRIPWNKKDKSWVVREALEAGARLNSILGKVDRGEGTLGLLLNDPTLYEEVKILVGGARRLGVATPEGDLLDAGPADDLDLLEIGRAHV